MSTESKQPSFVSYEKPAAERKVPPGEQKGEHAATPKRGKRDLPGLRPPITTLAIGEESGWPPWW